MGAELRQRLRTSHVAVLRLLAADVFNRARHLAQSTDDPNRAALIEVLRLRLDASLVALEATQALVLQAGARNYLRGSDADRRCREAHFVAIVTPSIKKITRELAAG